MINTITIMGRLTDDPVARDYLVDEQKKVAVSFSLAVAETSKKTSFIPCVYYGEAETLQAHVEKGDRLVVSGRLSQRTYETLEGKKRSILEVIVRDFNFVEPKKEEPVVEKHEETADSNVPF